MLVRWLGHAAFYVEAEGAKIYIDPFELPGFAEKADIILITHGHYDHCDLKSIEKIQTPSTLVVMPESCAGKVSGNVQLLKPGENLKENDIMIHAVHSYNIKKPSHPKGIGLGYVIEAEGKKLYHAGDSDFIHEMTKLEDINVALLPIGGKYTMDFLEAVEAVKAINPEIVVPMHYGSVVGSDQDAEKFKELLDKEMPELRVELLEGQDLEL
jgi:L-ascorbate metabolism protein UlaG (beta-lactamase superfamily)